MKSPDEIKKFIDQELADIRLTRKLSEKRRDRDQLLGSIFALRNMRIFLFGEDLPNPEAEQIYKELGEVQ